MVRHLLLRPSVLLALMSVLIVPSHSQTKLDLQHQARGVDFSSSTYTKPVRMGIALPATCMAGEGFLLASAPAGSNLYFCLSPNIWALQGTPSGPDNSSAGSLSSLATAISGPVLTVGAGCSNVVPCNVRVGSIIYAITNPATVTLQAGTGTAYIYLTPAGTVTVGHNLSLTCTSVCTAVPGVTSFPMDSVPISTWAASAGTWGVGTDERAPYGRDLITVSNGLVGAQSAGSTTLSVDPTVVATYAVLGSSFSPPGDIDATAGATLLSPFLTVRGLNGVALGGLNTGLLKITNGSGLPSTAVPGTDYAPATSGTALMKANGAGGFSAAVAGVDFAAAPSGSAIQKADGSGRLTPAVPGTDFDAPGAAAAAQAAAQTYASNASNLASGTVGGARLSAATPTTQGAVGLPSGATSNVLGTAASGVQGTSYFQSSNYGNGTTNGIQSGISAAGSSPGLVLAPFAYPSTEMRPCNWSNMGQLVAGDGCLYSMPPGLTFQDQRFGVYSENADSSGIRPNSNYWAWQQEDHLGTAAFPTTPNGSINRVTHAFSFVGLNGGYNLSANGYADKSWQIPVDVFLYGYAPGQKIGIRNSVNSYGAGDAVGILSTATCFAGYNAQHDEMCEAHNFQALQGNVEYTGTVASSFANTVMVSVSAGSGTQGAGRYLVDTAAAISAGNITAVTFTNANTPLTLTGSGTTWPISTVNTTSVTAVTAPGSGTVTVGSISGITTSTKLCYADPYTFEQVVPIAVAGSTFTAIFRYPHAAGAIVAAGGMCGYYVDLTADDATGATWNSYVINPLINTLHYVFPIIRSTSSKSIDTWYSAPNQGYRPYLGRWNSSTGNGYAAYPGAEVTTVAQAQKLSDTLTVEVPVSFSNGDGVALPIYFNLDSNVGISYAQSLFPRTQSSRGISSLGYVGPLSYSSSMLDINWGAPSACYSTFACTPGLGITFSGNEYLRAMIYSSKTTPAGAYLMNDQSTSPVDYIWQLEATSWGLLRGDPANHIFGIGIQNVGVRLGFDWRNGNVNMLSSAVLGFGSTISAAVNTGISSVSSGVVGIGNGVAADVSGTMQLTNIKGPVAAPLRSLSPVALPVYSAVGAPLPACGGSYLHSIAIVTDATSPTYGGTYVSGGAVETLVECNGSGAWKTH